jgi:fatty acid desaturase
VVDTHDHAPRCLARRRRPQDQREQTTQLAASIAILRGMRITTARAVAWSLAAMVLMCFGTPLCALWAQPQAPWWTAYALWAAAILTLLFAARGSAREGTDQRPDTPEHTEPSA